MRSTQRTNQPAQQETTQIHGELALRLSAGGGGRVILGHSTYAYTNYATLHEARRWAVENGHPHRPVNMRAKLPDGPFKRCVDDEILEVLWNLRSGTWPHGYAFPRVTANIWAATRLASSFQVLFCPYPCRLHGATPFSPSA